MLLGGVMVTNKQKQLVYEWKQAYETLANVDETRRAAELIGSTGSSSSSSKL